MASPAPAYSTEHSDPDNKISIAPYSVSNDATCETPDDQSVEDRGILNAQSIIEQQKRQEWQESLAKLEGEIQTLKQVLMSKERQMQDLKRKLGISPLKDFQQNISSGLKKVQDSSAVKKTKEDLKSWNDWMWGTNSYKKSKESIKTAGVRSKDAISTMSRSTSQKFGKLRDSQTYKSMEEGVVSGWTNFRQKVLYQKPEEMNNESNFEQALAADQGNASSGEEEINLSAAKTTS